MVTSCKGCVLLSAHGEYTMHLMLHTLDVKWVPCLLSCLAEVRTNICMTSRVSWSAVLGTPSWLTAGFMQQLRDFWNAICAI